MNASLPSVVGMRHIRDILSTRTAHEKMFTRTATVLMAADLCPIEARTEDRNHLAAH